MSAANPPLPFELGSVITDSRKQLQLELLEALGSGSYAIVYKAQAQAQDDQRLYALKCISKLDLSNEDLELQRQEVEIHRSFVKSSRIVHLYSHFETEQYVFLLLEYIQGTDLYWWILHKGDHYDSTNGRKLDILERLELLCNIFEQCLDAVDAVHNKNIAHRDLKPENFLITLDKTIKLIDFGLATTEQYPTDFDCGSKPYMSFECHNPENPNYDAFQADIWSLGIIFINLFWHRSPWSRPDDTCPAYTCFTHNPIEFLMERFEGMTKPIATFLADRVFCSEKKGRVRTGEWKSWCKNLVNMFSEDGSRPSTPKKTIGFLPLSISLSTLTSRSGSKSRESVLSARIRRSSFFSLLPPSPVPCNKPIPAEDECNYVPMPENYELYKSIDQHSKSWSQEFDFDGGELDFSEPISFADGSTVKTPEESKKEQDDNDSGFGSDEPEGTRQSFDSGQESTTANASEEENKPASNKVPKYIPPAKRSDRVPPMDIRAPSAQHWRRPPPSSPLSALPSSVGGRGYHVGAQNRRPFAPPQPSWRIKHQRSENWPKSNAIYNHHKHQNDKLARHSSSPSFIYQKKYDKIPVTGDKKGPHVPVYTPPNRMSTSTFASASVSIFNNRMPGMTTYKSLNVSNKETAPILDEEKPADDLEMSEMDVVFGEDQLVSQPVNVERRNHLTKGAISDFGKLLRSIARDRNQ